MRKPFKERQQFWCLFFFFRVFRQPITNLVSSGSNCRSSSAALFAFLSAAIIFRVGTPTDTTSSRTGLAAHKWWKRGERATRDDRAGRRGVHRMARSHFSFFILGCPLSNQWQPGVKAISPMMHQYPTSWSPTNQIPGNAHTSWSPANQRWGHAESSWSPSNGKWTVHDLRNPIWRVRVLCAATNWRLRLGFRLGCLGDPILVLLLKFDAQIERKKK